MPKQVVTGFPERVTILGFVDQFTRKWVTVGARRHHRVTGIPGPVGQLLDSGPRTEQE